MYPDQLIEFEEIISTVNDTMHGISTVISTRPQLVSTATSMSQPRNVDTKYDDTHIIGYEQAKQFLHENIVLPLTITPEQYDILFQGIRSRSNILLFGPPGSGKSCLVRSAAQQASAPLRIIYPSDILSKYQGESERSLSQLFDVSNDEIDQKRILFFDGTCCGLFFFPSIRCHRI